MKILPLIAHIVRRLPTKWRSFRDVTSPRVSQPTYAILVADLFGRQLFHCTALYFYLGPPKKQNLGGTLRCFCPGTENPSYATESFQALNSHAHVQPGVTSYRPTL